jgi:hypothetical protein
MHQACLFQGGHLRSDPILVLLFGLGDVNWKLVADRRTSLAVLYKILVDRLREVSFAWFLNVVASGKEEATCNRDEKQSAHEISSDAS